MSPKRYTGEFWTKVLKAGRDECWPWLGYKKPSGHGLTTMHSFCISANRKAWILTHGPIRGGLSVLHKCDNAACCNPAHMYLGTRADNMIDRFSNPMAGDRKARGRRFMLDDAEMARLWQMRSKGALLRECAQEFGVHIATIVRYINNIRKQRLAVLRSDRLSAVTRKSV